jgi:hypothetical protein
MVARQEYAPEGDSSSPDVAEILENNPDIRTMVEMVAGRAASYFRWIAVSLDTRQYEDWDPPLRITITVPYTGEEEWARQYKEFKTWLVQQADYDLNRLSVMVLPRKVQGPEE